MACLSVLMAEEKLDFKTLSEAHVVHLESQMKDYNDKLIEAGSTIFDSLVYDRFDKKQATKNSIHDDYVDHDNNRGVRDVYKHYLEYYRRLSSKFRR